MRAIETSYAGCRFRSRLEARWAVFFDHRDIEWQYEVQGYTLDDGRRYLPDFFLPQCATWVEVKGDLNRLDLDLLACAARELEQPPHPGETGPVFMLLGPIPRPKPMDWSWRGWDREGVPGLYGLGNFEKNLRPWWNDGIENQPNPLEPVLERYEAGCPDAYTAARSARFEFKHRKGRPMP